MEPRLSPGGSSGGAAAAIATGMSALELGSDLTGSIHWPGHCCGIIGLKTTWNLCPGLIETPMSDQMKAAGQADAPREVMKDVPIGRVGRAEEIADAALWLCNSKASLMVGQRSRWTAVTPYAEDESCGSERL